MKGLRIALIVSTLSAVAFNASAALPTGVTTAMTAMSDNIDALGILLVGVAAVAVGYKWLKGMLFG